MTLTKNDKKKGCKGCWYHDNDDFKHTCSSERCKEENYIWVLAPDLIKDDEEDCELE
jgi:hypothetical protein